MIAHVVLFRPKATLDDATRRELIAAIEQALTNIPTISHARVGRRRVMGRLYDQANREEFPFIAILEFESEAALREYLDHPAHHALGEQFYLTSDVSLVYDFELVEGHRASELLS